MYPFTVRYYSVILIISIFISMAACTPKVADTNIENGSTESDASETTGPINEPGVTTDSEIETRSSGDYEPYPVLKASEILPPELLKSDHHEVVEEVTNDCIWNSYTINSDFGEYEAVNANILKTRVNEINATARLKETSGAGAIATGAADSVIVPFKSAINMASNPVDTVKGVPGGIVTFFKKIYYSGEKVVVVTGQTVQSAGSAVAGSGEEDSEEGETFSNLTGNVAYLTDWYLGISGGERRVAKKVGVDPYTSNPELAAELNRVAKYDRIGRLGLGFANIPSVPGMGYIKDVNHYVWDKDPKELRDFNKKNLLEIGIDKELVEEFLDSPYYSPTFQTTIVFSLLQIPDVINREEVIEDAVVATSLSESRFFMNLVLLLVWFNNNETPLKEIINHGDITSGLTIDNKIITIIPVDYVCWSEKVAESARFHDQVFSKVEAQGRELWVVGQISDRAVSEYNNLGWEVHQKDSIEAEPVTEEIDKSESTKGINKRAFDVLKEDNIEKNDPKN